ncbi:MAG: hypothetical protein NT030_08520 [Candidatus Saganbacteria bacterium]|nr:hypothetical protein [Candidatus Saganbacteria bacterium]
MWPILEIIAIISLIIFWRGPNAVWGGGAIGIIGGLIAAVISSLYGKGLFWSILGKWIVIGIVLGVVTELLWKFASYVSFKKGV